MILKGVILYDQMVCFAMRMKSFKAELWDDDYGLDDLVHKWPEVINVEPTGRTRTINNGRGPRLVFKTEKVGW